MDQSNALLKILESTDLVRMVEDLLAPAAVDKISAASVSGMRITLRNIREGLLASHDALASGMVNRARASLVDTQTSNINTNGSSKETTIASTSADLTRGSASFVTTESAKYPITRRDLKAQIEKIIER